MLTSLPSCVRMCNDGSPDRMLRGHGSRNVGAHVARNIAVAQHNHNTFIRRYPRSQQSLEQGSYFRNSFNEGSNTERRERRYQWVPFKSHIKCSEPKERGQDRYRRSFNSMQSRQLYRAAAELERTFRSSHVTRDCACELPTGKGSPLLQPVRMRIT